MTPHEGVLAEVLSDWVKNYRSELDREITEAIITHGDDHVRRGAKVDEILWQGGTTLHHVFDAIEKLLPGVKLTPPPDRSNVLDLRPARCNHSHPCGESND